MGRLTTKEFIKRAKKIHGNKYDYSKVEYKNMSTKVCIICPKHGEFWQSPKHHLGKCGCAKCTKPNQFITTEEFIKKAKEKHRDKYDYSKTEYLGPGKKVCIICPEHGEFWQVASKHLKGQGCPFCKIEIIKKSVRKLKSTEEFIKRAKEKHGDKYDYSKVEYKGNTKRVCVICPEHGEFWVAAGQHLNGKGCMKCSNPNYRMSNEEFIKRAKEIHGDKYDYSKTRYTTIKKNVCIICPEHGEFWQRPSHHLAGHDCPNCAHLSKSYKFNLLKEFESEYSFRAFLENNDPNILLAILNNICETDPKFNPIKKDLEKALENSEKEDPIYKLEEKYSSNNVDTEVEVKEDNTPVKIDLDNEDQFDEIFGEIDKNQQEKELTLEDAIKNTEKEIKIINKIDHLIAPELRKKIMKKLINDKLRQFMELNS